MLNNENAIYYECGYSCDNAIYISFGSEAFFITDGRYTIDAQKNVKFATVVIDGDLYAMAIKIIKKSKIKKMIFDPKEWSVYGLDRLRSGLKVKFEPVVDFSHKRRIVKTKEEIEILSTSAKLGAKAFKQLAKAFRKSGLGKDEYTLTHIARGVLADEGLYGLSFDPIVAIDENASKPHATPTDKKLKKDSLLLVDAGLKYRRYCSDRTRTVSFDKYMMCDTHQSFK